jgi:cytochrome c551/c552
MEDFLMDGKKYITVAITALLFMLVFSFATNAQVDKKPIFVTSDKCIACHSNMSDEHGNKFSIGHTWRASIMALSARDPYWQAGVKREIADRPDLQKDIENICSVCHMPMFNTSAKANGKDPEIIRYYEGGFTPEEQKIAVDGVSCSVCHQIAEENLGKHSSFDGGYVITSSIPEQSKVIGPYEIEAGLKKIMQSSSSMNPEKGTHIQQSEVCATCHTLFTPAVDGEGNKIGEFAEQVPYLEWKHSAYFNDKSCQGCHMPEVSGKAQISSVLGDMRENVSQHKFRGGNVFMLKLFDKYRNELNVSTPSEDLQASIETTLNYLQNKSASVEITSVEIDNSVATIKVAVTNKAGHKLPTAYPSRRAWLNTLVQDQNGKTLFESGALNPDGSIAGNDNDSNAEKYEPHYLEITSEDQVQIYEPIIHDYKKHVTTSLLSGATYAKDNRLLPKGFDKASAENDVSVYGEAEKDENFTAEGDIIIYKVQLPEGVNSVQVSAKLMYQTIGYRWAQNLKSYDNDEAKLFTGYYDENADISAVVLAEAVRK